LCLVRSFEAFSGYDMYVPMETAYLVLPGISALLIGPHSSRIISEQTSLSSGGFRDFSPSSPPQILLFPPQILRWDFASGYIELIDLLLHKASGRPPCLTRV
jgi:hypothetical protein